MTLLNNFLKTISTIKAFYLSFFSKFLFLVDVIFQSYIYFVSFMNSLMKKGIFFKYLGNAQKEN